MNKELLYAPLVECRDNYNSFFEKEKTQGKIQESEMERFKKQYKIIDQIIVTLDNDPENKEKLMQLFEEMQEYGQPPAGIASVTLPGGM
jgi:peroxin-19